MRLLVPTEESGARLDVWLSRHLTELSRSRIQALIKSRDITVDGLAARSSHKTVAGEFVEVVVPPARATELLAQDISLDILYEDAELIVVNKSVGLVVHPAAGHDAGTLVNALLYHCGDDLTGVGGEQRPGIVHRLDKDTSGALVAAKNERVLEDLAEQFKQGLVRKEYVAIVYGKPFPVAGRIETLIGRSDGNRKKMAARPLAKEGKGRRAVTHYQVTESFAKTSLLRVRLETGRTHQIRVHMSHIGHPIMGDSLYGRSRQGFSANQIPDRQMLHAQLLCFQHPVSKKEMTFQAPILPDMQALLDELRREKASQKT